jgi:hypothetical protein
MQRLLMLLPVVAVLIAAGCASSSSPRLSSLGREVDLTPLRGQGDDQVHRDDAECVAWTRATKGLDEPFEYAELRYASCATARGYRATIGGVSLGSPQDRPHETVVADWRTCRADKLIQEVGFDMGRREAALNCLKGRGYVR